MESAGCGVFLEGMEYVYTIYTVYNPPSPPKKTRCFRIFGNFSAPKKKFEEFRPIKLNNGSHWNFLQQMFGDSELGNPSIFKVPVVQLRDSKVMVVAVFRLGSSSTHSFKEKHLYQDKSGLYGI